MSIWKHVTATPDLPRDARGRRCASPERPVLRRTAVLFAAAFAVLAAPLLAPTLATPAQAAQDLKLVCPKDGEPFYRNRSNGKKVAIDDAEHKAMAAQICSSGLAATEETTTVNLVNSRTTPIYVNFTVDHVPGAIVWGAGCTKSGAGARIAAGGTCAATVSHDNASTRFCADLAAVPADCQNAQNNHQTMVETIFQPSSAGGCFNKGACVWFDISVIPSTCTDPLWQNNRCAGTGGASYNLPVSISCGGTAIYTCQGPPSGTYGPEMYPSKCGNPLSTTAGGGPNNQNAYFYPMFVPPESGYQPNTVCLGGSAFTVDFLAGP